MKNAFKWILTLATAVFVLSSTEVFAAEVKVTVYALNGCGFCKMLRDELTKETGSETRVRVDSIDTPVQWLNHTRSEAAKLPRTIGGFPTTFITSADGKNSRKVSGADLPKIKAAIRAIRNDESAPVPAPVAKKTSTSPTKKAAPKTVEQKVGYYAWVSFDDGNDYCLQTDQYAVPISEEPVDAKICEEIYGK